MASPANTNYEESGSENDTFTVKKEATCIRDVIVATLCSPVRKIPARMPSFVQTRHNPNCRQKSLFREAIESAKLKPKAFQVFKKSVNHSKPSFKCFHCNKKCNSKSRRYHHAVTHNKYNSRNVGTNWMRKINERTQRKEALRTRTFPSTNTCFNDVDTKLSDLFSSISSTLESRNGGSMARDTKNDASDTVKIQKTVSEALDPQLESKSYTELVCERVFENDENSKASQTRMSIEKRIESYFRSSNNNDMRMKGGIYDTNYSIYLPMQFEGILKGGM